VLKAVLGQTARKEEGRRSGIKRGHTDMTDLITKDEDGNTENCNFQEKLNGENVEKEGFQGLRK